MSAVDGAERQVTGDLASFPRFDLCCLVDDTDRPTKVMIAPNSEDGNGFERWITMDVEHAVSLDEIP